MVNEKLTEGRTIEALVDRNQNGETSLLSPTVGEWGGRPVVGETVVGGQAIGWVDILGRRTQLVLPDTTMGVVFTVCSATSLEYGGALLTFRALEASGVDSLSTEQPDTDDSPTFCAPSSGRVYLRPSPNDEPYIAVGQHIRFGDTVALLEVMKTFTQVAYATSRSGSQLPKIAAIHRIFVEDGADVAAGEPLFEVGEALQSDDGNDRVND